VKTYETDELLTKVLTNEGTLHILLFLRLA